MGTSYFYSNQVTSKMLCILALTLLASNAMSYPYLMYPTNSLYGSMTYPGYYGNYGNNYGSYGYGVSPDAESDFVELAKVNGKATPLGEEALEFVKELVPKSGNIVKNGNVKTKYGNIP